MKNVEIERKWMVKGWPNNLELLYIEKMRQGYISTSPTVRIRDGILSISYVLSQRVSCLEKK